jgi:hypothetical protein
VELVEAARTGQIALAAGAVERLARTTRLSGTQRGLGIEARSRALVSDSGGAEPLYLEASRAPASPAPVFPGPGLPGPGLPVPAPLPVPPVPQLPPPRPASAARHCMNAAFMQLKDPVA